MGRHSKVEPKKVSFLASAGGIFAAVALATGLFAVSQATDNNPFQAAPPVERETTNVPRLDDSRVPNTGTPTSSLPGPTTPVVPSESATEPPNVIVSVVPPQAPIQPPTKSPGPNPSPGTPDVDVGVDTDVEVRVPLLGQAVDTVGEIVEGVTDPVKDLLDK